MRCEARGLRKGAVTDMKTEQLRREEIYSEVQPPHFDSLEIVASSGISLRFWRLYAQAWLVCLAFPLFALLHMPLALVELILVLSGIALYVACYTWTMWSHPVYSVARSPTQIRRSLILLAGLTVLVLVFSVTYGPTFLWLLIGISAMAGITLPVRSAFWAVMALTLLTLFVAIGLSGGLAASDWQHIIPLVLLVRGLGLDMFGLARLSKALREVHAARGDLARLAVTEERLRVARDLHDLLGHTLSLIVLKSELARRLAEQDPRRAVQEIYEVERVARQTLHEVREAVAGYRQPRLKSELDGARQLLDAAGIACHIEHAAGPLPPAIDAILAWAVREGVTNVIRHSRAQRCTVRVRCESGRACTEITNDGTLPNGEDRFHRAGSGLAGLTERVCAQGGQVEAGPMPGADTPGFRLRVELPIPDTLTSGKGSLP